MVSTKVLGAGSQPVSPIAMLIPASTAPSTSLIAGMVRSTIQPIRMLIWPILTVMCRPVHVSPLTRPAFPNIFIENQFDLHSVVDEVKPNTFVLAMGDDTGYGWHADFFNGWEEGAIPAILASCPPNKYGNEDIGLCSAMKKTSTPNGKCTLTSSYDEEVTLPGDALPGCNPVSDTNPAPIYAAAPLGVASKGPCALAAAGAAAAHGSPASAPAVSSQATEPEPSTVATVDSSSAVTSSTIVSSDSESRLAPVTVDSSSEATTSTTSSEVSPETSVTSPAYNVVTESITATDDDDAAAVATATVTGDVVTVTEISYARVTKAHRYHQNDNNDSKRHKLRRHIQRHAKHGF
nr:hypothetical protein CFP56_31562 [Quercus suber]